MDLFLLHGALGAKDQFELLASKLENTCKVHTLNFSGHGGTQMPDRFSIETFAEDVLCYLSQNNLKSVSVFGYSMGGYVALYLARHYADKIDAVFTFGTKFLWTPEIAMREIKMLDADKISDKVPAFAAQLQKRHGADHWKQLLQKTSELMVSLGNENVLHADDCHRIGQPVLITVGDRDAAVTIEECVAIFRKLPSANLAVFPNTVHFIEKVDLNRLVSEIESFFIRAS